MQMPFVTYGLILDSDLRAVSTFYLIMIHAIGIFVASRYEDRA